tara:strand:+ start:50 stop:637 length:588 start_codon:yes stop_codon:yes gene_type:complete
MNKFIEAELFSIDKLIPHPNNPRYIDEHKYTELKNSISESSWMMQIRPVIIDENNLILCGNMRYKACIELGYIEIWTKQYSDFTQEEKQELILKDNISSGDWDLEALEKDWTNTAYKKWLGSQPVSYDDLDYEDLVLDLDTMEGNVKRSIHLKINKHEQEITDMIKSLRDKGVYIGKVFIDALSNEKSRPNTNKA